MSDNVVEVAYIPGDGKQWLEEVRFKPGMTIQSAIESTSFYSDYEVLIAGNYIAGVWSEKRELDSFVEPGDRVEIYRDLEIDPKLRRKIKAKEQGFDLKNNRKKKD